MRWCLDTDRTSAFAAVSMPMLQERCSLSGVTRLRLELLKCSVNPRSGQEVNTTQQYRDDVYICIYIYIFVIIDTRIFVLYIECILILHTRIH